MNVRWSHGKNVKFIVTVMYEGHIIVYEGIHKNTLFYIFNICNPCSMKFSLVTKDLYK